MAETKKINVGRRKTSIAQAELKKGKGAVTVNAKPYTEYFGNSVRYQKIVTAPFEATGVKDMDAVVKVTGGGIASQAGAVRHAISRSLALMSDDFKKIVKKAGFLTRDPRMVERKKPGQPKARKRFQFSKR
ncbi:small subunit ribosomal protein S9 [Parelusimicrobium proximum]|uniref:30S ribosomal protein S9 n=1 Tax=Parelusimicrobium proximum TaxID=3228953 RepID=UPI003D16E608